MVRYLHYVETPGAIQTSEIAPYKKQWMQRALVLVPDRLINAPLIKSLYQEVFSSYLRAVKQAIVDYVVRSQYERLRLGIVVLPAASETASSL